jgi:hypothetical protein
MAGRIVTIGEHVLARSMFTPSVDRRKTDLCEKGKDNFIVPGFREYKKKNSDYNLFTMK